MDGAYSLSAYDFSLVKDCMKKLVQAAREDFPVSPSRFSEGSAYSPDEALMDLLAILDNRAEQERRGGELTGVLSQHMWGICRRATAYVNENFWIEKNLLEEVDSKAAIREITYRALSIFIEKSPRLN